MDFLIDKLGIYSGATLGKQTEGVQSGPFGNATQKLINSASKLADTLNADTSLDSGEAASISLDAQSTNRAGVSALLSSAQSVLSIASDALTQINELQYKQFENATEAANSPQGSLTESDNAENQTLNTEIDRIKSAATFNGQNIFTSISALTGNNDGTQTLVLNVPSVGSFTFSSASTFTTQASADSSAESLEDALASSLQLSSAFNSAKSEVSSAIVEQATVRAEVPDALTEESVSELAQKIASTIASPFNDEKSKQQIIDASIGNLNIERAQELLQP